jgi:hypothetical protein
MSWQSLATMASTLAPGLNRWAVPEAMWMAVWGIGLLDLAFASRIRSWWKDDANESLYCRSQGRGPHDAVRGSGIRRRPETR